MISAAFFLSCAFASVPSQAWAKAASGGRDGDAACGAPEMDSVAMLQARGRPASLAKGKEEVLSTAISRYNTPGCCYKENLTKEEKLAPCEGEFNVTEDWPPKHLQECTEAIPADVPDMRGLWGSDDGEFERVEQCGLRMLIVGGGVIHDTVIADGTVKNGVNDVSFSDCSPISCAGKFENNSFVFYLIGDDGAETEVVRRTLSSDGQTVTFVNPKVEGGGTVYHRVSSSDEI